MSRISFLTGVIIQRFYSLASLTVLQPVFRTVLCSFAQTLNSHCYWECCATYRFEKDADGPFLFFVSLSLIRKAVGQSEGAALHAVQQSSVRSAFFSIRHCMLFKKSQLVNACKLMSHSYGPKKKKKDTLKVSPEYMTDNPNTVKMECVFSADGSNGYVCLLNTNKLLVRFSTRYVKKKKRQNGHFFITQ